MYIVRKNGNILDHYLDGLRENKIKLKVYYKGYNDVLVGEMKNETFSVKKK